MNTTKKVQTARISASTYQRGVSAGLRKAAKRMKGDCSRSCTPTNAKDGTECDMCFYDDTFSQMANESAPLTPSQGGVLSPSEAVLLAIAVLKDQHAALVNGTCEGGCPDEKAVEGLEALLASGAF